MENNNVLTLDGKSPIKHFCENLAYIKKLSSTITDKIPKDDLDIVLYDIDKILNELTAPTDFHYGDMGEINVIYNVMNHTLEENCGSSLRDDSLIIMRTFCDTFMCFFEDYTRKKLTVVDTTKYVGDERIVGLMKDICSGREDYEEILKKNNLTKEEMKKKFMK